MILEIFVYSYLITTGISLLTAPIWTFLQSKKEHGVRKAVIESIVAGAICLIPYLCFACLICVICIYGNKGIRIGIKEWVENDPTSPKNIKDPNFVPPPKKEKKCIPIKDRFEIMDL